MKQSLTEKIAGTWVADADMSPYTNISGRRWWAAGDLEGVYLGGWTTPDGMKPKGLHWFFPSDS